VSQHAVIRRWLKVADPTAITARETLQRALQFGRRVEDVERSELFCVVWDTPQQGAEAMLEGLAVETTLISNPNKHRVEVAVGGDAVHPRGNVWVLVWEPGDGAGLEAAVRRLGLLAEPPARIRQAVLWELALDGSPAEVADRAREIAVARSRTSGLLANLQYQRAEVFTRPPTASQIVSRVTAPETTEVA